MKRVLFAIAALFAVTLSEAQPRFVQTPFPENVVLRLRDTSPRSNEGRSSNFSPTFFVYPNAAVDSLGAVKLIGEMGLDKIIPDFHASVFVINPVGAKYDAVKDFESFVTLYDICRSGNLKVIGIGKGADFVNSTLFHKAHGAIAGILAIDGKASKLTKEKYWGVPAYIVGKNAKSVANSYIQANNAVVKSTDKTVSVYENPEEPLLKVVVNTATDQSLNEQFNDAWSKLLCKNYRFNNYKHTHYEGNKFNQYGANELEPFTIHEDLGIVRNIVVAEQGGNSLPWLWYEYWPEELMEGAPEKSVPVMVLLHGNGNDPRTQAETSGFIELAAEDRFFVVEMEWQGSSTAGVMGHDGVESVLYTLLDKYPQLDPSRIYCEGLSAGSITSLQLGIRKSFVFAAVGGHSGGLFGSYRTGPLGNFRSLMNEVAQKSGKIQMPYFLITGNADNVVTFYNKDNWKDNSILNAWNAYRQLNGIPIAETIDFDVDPIFGFELEDRERIVTNKGEGIVIETGQLYSNGIPLVKCGVVVDYGHWNFKPDARLLWDFFMHYSRDPQTKEIIYTE